MKKLTSKMIIGRLTQTYKLPEWELFTEVCNDIMSPNARRADAIALSLWTQSETHPRIIVRGFEIKVNRSDWLQELKQPQKSETILGKQV
jgi:hypothetical protein